MTPKEASRKIWEDMKSKPFKERLTYFWDYYKWHTLAVFALLIVAISYTVSLLQAPDYKVNGLLLNAYSYLDYEQIQENVQLLEDTFSEQAQLPEKNVQINLDASRVYDPTGENETYNYDTMQLMLTYIASDALDFAIGDEDTMLALAYMQVFQDLRSVLSEQQFQACSDDLLYIDYAVVEAREEALNQDLDASGIVYPDPSEPDKMEDPIPVFIRLDQTNMLNEIYVQPSGELEFGFTGSNQYGYAEEFLRYLLDSENQ